MSRDNAYLADILDYDDVDPKRVCADSQNDLPPLIARLRQYLAAQSENPGTET